MKKIYFVPLFLFLFISCSSHFSKKNAIEQIQNSDKIKKEIYVHCLFSWGGLMGGYYSDLGHYNSNKQFIQYLKNNKYITPLKEGENYIVVKLNEKILPYVIKKTYISECVHIIIGEFENIKITGVEDESEFKKTVHFEVNYKKNEIGAYFDNPSMFVIQDDVSFKKFDDGWRIDN